MSLLLDHAFYGVGLGGVWWGRVVMCTSDPSHLVFQRVDTSLLSEESFFFTIQNVIRKKTKLICRGNWFCSDKQGLPPWPYEKSPKNIYILINHLHTWHRPQHALSCPCLYSCLSRYPHLPCSTWWSQVDYPHIISSKKPRMSFAFFSFTHNESSDKACSGSIHGDGKDRDIFGGTRQRDLQFHKYNWPFVFVFPLGGKVCEIRNLAFVIFNAQGQHKAMCTEHPQ